MCNFEDGVGLRLKKRFLLYNPADLSTAIGYQNHQVHDLTSLVNEASGTAHGTGSGNTQNGQFVAGYNVPNFPGMGQHPAMPQIGNLASTSGGSSSMVFGQTGSGGTAFSVSSGAGSASFSGTNQWRCDAHVVESCDIQCMDVDPKDGCPFCIPGCNLTFGGATSTGGQGSQSFGQSLGQGTSGSKTGGLSQNPGTLAGGTSQSGGLLQSLGMLSGGSSQLGSLGQNVGTLSSTAGQPSLGLGGNLLQQPSGLSGTNWNTHDTQSFQGTQNTQSNQGTQNAQGTQSNQGTQNTQNNQGTSASGTTSGTVPCQHFPSNCPKVYTALDKNGCLVCTILAQSSQTTMTPPPTTTPQHTSRTCAPKRCVPPCNKGVVIDAYGCPQCICPEHV